MAANFTQKMKLKDRKFDFTTFKMLSEEADIFDFHETFVNITLDCNLGSVPERNENFLLGRFYRPNCKSHKLIINY